MQGPGLPCVHCGLCLDTCPTYRVLGTESDSPRGRIYLMEAVREGNLALDRSTSAHLDGCLGCLACETACPSGVSFHERIEQFRPRLARGTAATVWRSIVGRIGASPWALRTALRVARALDTAGAERLRRRLPGLGLMPRKEGERCSARLAPLARSRVPAPRRPRARAAVLTGCAGDVLRPQINRACIEALHANDVAVVEVSGQGCCGALALHAGRTDEALEHARRNAAAFAEAGVDFVVTTAAGCGAMVKDYARLLSTDRRCGAAAARVASAARDVSEVLVQIGLREPLERLVVDGPVAYHDACHLLHACRIASPPRAVVAAAIGREPVDLGENAICCGSAGSYNLDNPSLARALGARKTELARESGVALVAVGNVGCLLQMEQSFALVGLRTPVRHPVELLADAYLLGGSGR